MEQLENSEKKVFCFQYVCYWEGISSNNQAIFYPAF